MIGYSPKFPLEFDNYLGAYAATTTLQEVVKQNFINLMLTVRGERIMDINFGVGLRHYLFEQNTPILQVAIIKDIRAQVAKYMPFVKLGSIDFNQGQLLDGYEDQILKISIKYSVPALNVTDVVSFDSTGS